MEHWQGFIYMLSSYLRISILKRILEIRMRKVLESDKILSLSQHGFRKARRTSLHINEMFKSTLSDLAIERRAAVLNTDLQTA